MVNLFNSSQSPINQDLINCFTVCFILTLVSFVATVCITILISKKRRKVDIYDTSSGTFLLSPFYFFIAGVFVSACFMFFPLSYADAFLNASGSIDWSISVARGVKAFALSIHNGMRSFAGELGYLEVKDLIYSVLGECALANCYSVVALVVSVGAPILVIGFVLSLFKSIVDYVVYACSFRKFVCYISELNEKSFALAYDVAKNGILDSKTKKRRKALVVFCGVDDKDEKLSDLIDNAKRIGALCFSKDITAIKLKSNKNTNKKFFFISENESDNVNKALKVVKTCKCNKKLNNKNTECYVFATTASSEALLDTVSASNATENENLSEEFNEIKIRRVNSQRNLVYNILAEHSIFKNNIVCESGYKLNVLIVGFGKQGVEFFKAICWYGQMIGYELNIHVFDQCDNLEEKARALMPELIEYNGVKMDGEPYYNIKFYSGMDIKSSEFNDKIKEIKDVTTAYILLGDDELNLETSIKLSTEYARVYGNEKLKDLDIFAVVYNAAQNRVIKDNGGLSNIAGKEGYNITLIGDVVSRYSLDSIIMQKEEEMAMECHLKWVSTFDKEVQESSRREFYRYEYYRNSSMSEILHKLRRHSLNIKEGERLERYSYKNTTVDVLEHKRWNAYMRSEGFVRGDKKDLIAKIHKDLIPFDELSQADKDKDKIVNS